ncbi:MAG: SPASM domain-containing protein [bacterium]|nr:SPASM domain-containing protein [bacterium]
MTKSAKSDINYRFNIALRHLAKEILRAFYHYVYKPLRPGIQFHCRNIFEGQNALVFSNGEVTCVCADHGLINLGSVRDASLEEIWMGKGFEDLRASFRANRLPLRHCSACFAFERVPKTAKDLCHIAPFFWNIHLETTPVCNLQYAICRRDEVEHHRGGTRLEPPMVYRLLDEVPI